MFAETGAFIFGRRTYEIAAGWGGHHPGTGRRLRVVLADLVDADLADGADSAWWAAAARAVS